MPTLTKNFADIVAFSRATQGWRINSAGLLVPEAAGVPRIDYDPVTLAPRGLMLEEQRTNLVLRSADIGGAGFYAATTVVDTAAATAPDGTQSAARLTAMGGDSAWGRGATGVAPLTAHVFSVWLRADVPTTLGIYIVDSGGGTGNTSQSCNVATQWQRFLVTRTTSAGTTAANVQIGGAGSFSTGEVVYAWGIQLEAGAYASTYIPTTTAQVTRAADVATIQLPYACDLLVQDRAGAEWRSGLSAGAYALSPRAGMTYVSRIRAYPAGSLDSATKAAMAVAA